MMSAGGGEVAARHALVSLVGRLMLAQAAATGVIGLAFARRAAAGLTVTLVLAAALCGLAALARSGTHLAWLTAVAAESAFVVAGFARLLWSADYLGGTLLAIGTLGVLAHPAVSKAYARAATRPAEGDVRVLVTQPSPQALIRHDDSRARGRESAAGRARYALGGRHTVRGGCRTA
jgi:hypothetical protein